eukprot:8658028-Pyramimonas_sp.AAC.1
MWRMVYVMWRMVYVAQVPPAGGGPRGGGAAVGGGGGGGAEAGSVPGAAGALAAGAGVPAHGCRSRRVADAGRGAAHRRPR